MQMPVTQPSASQSRGNADPMTPLSSMIFPATYIPNAVSAQLSPNQIPIKITIKSKKNEKTNPWITIPS
jgi:hypothetical protein